MRPLAVLLTIQLVTMESAFGGTPEDCAGADLQRALTACSIIIDSGPTRQVDVPMAYFNRGRAYHLQGRQEPAISDLLEAIRLSPLYANAFDMLGNAMFQAGQTTAAIEKYSAAIRIEPDTSHFLYNRGNAYAATGDFTLAIADLTAAIRLEPRSARIYYNRGVAHSRTGNAKAAIEDFRQALSLDPSYDRARQALETFNEPQPLGEKK